MGDLARKGFSLFSFTLESINLQRPTNSLPDAPLNSNI